MGAEASRSEGGGRREEKPARPESAEWTIVQMLGDIDAFIKSPQLCVARDHDTRGHHDASDKPAADFLPDGNQGADDAAGADNASGAAGEERSPRRSTLQRQAASFLNELESRVSCTASGSIELLANKVRGSADYLANSPAADLLDAILMRQSPRHAPSHMNRIRTEKKMWSGRSGESPSRSPGISRQHLDRHLADSIDGQAVRLQSIKVSAGGLDRGGPLACCRCRRRLLPLAAGR